MKFRKNVRRTSTCTFFFVFAFIWNSGFVCDFHLKYQRPTFPTRYREKDTIKKLKLIDNPQFLSSPAPRPLRQNVDDPLLNIYMHIFQTSPLEAPIGRGVEGEEGDTFRVRERYTVSVKNHRDTRHSGSPFAAARTPKSLYPRYL